MNVEQARTWLDAVWLETLADGSNEPDPEVDRLVSSRVVSIRYAVLTQLLGKIADPTRSLMFFQLGNQEPGAWDARSFSVAIIVPWVSKNHDVIGTSAEPYVSKPLRRLRLERDAPHIRNRAEWAALYDFFIPLDIASPKELEVAFRRCLASVARRLANQSFKYQIPLRVSLPDLCKIMNAFLSEPSGGYRALVMTAALMRILGDGFSVFARVESQGVNEADATSGIPGDIMCYDLADVRASTRKAQESDTALSGLLFATPCILEQDRNTIQESMVATWASGLNVYQADIVDLARSAFVLLSEEWRPRLLRDIGNELDTRGDHEHRRAWHALLIQALS